MFPFCLVLLITGLTFHISITVLYIASLLIHAIINEEPQAAFCSTRKRLFERSDTSKQVSSCINLSFSISLPVATRLGPHIACLKLAHENILYVHLYIPTCVYTYLSNYLCANCLQDIGKEHSSGEKTLPTIKDSPTGFLEKEAQSM